MTRKLLQVCNGVKRSARSRGVGALLLLVAALACALFCFGWQVGGYTQTQAEKIADSYTTLAYAQPPLQMWYSEYTDEWWTMEGTLIDKEKLDQVLSDPTYIISANQGMSMGVCLTGVMPLTRASAGGETLSTAGINNTVLLKVTCKKMEQLDEIPTFGSYATADGKGFNPPENTFTVAQYATFTVDEVVIANADVAVGQTLTAGISAYDEEGNQLYKEGQQYYVLGLCSNPETLSIASSNGQLTVTQREDGTYLMKNLASLAMCDSALAEDETQRDALARRAQACAGGMMALGLNGAGLDGVVPFHDGVNFLLQGRNFTAEEMAAGAPVCIISQGVADRNGLTVGDTVTASFWNAYLFPESNNQNGQMTYFLGENPSEPFTFFQTDVPLTIVGIYGGATSVSTMYAVGVNTVFVPDKLLPEGGMTVETTNTLTLQKNTDEAFLAAMTAAGFDGLYTVSDGGFSQVVGSLQNMRRDGQTLLLACLLVALTLVVASVLLVLVRIRWEGRVLRQNGATAGECWLYALFSVLLPVAVGAALGGAAAGLFGKNVIAMLEKSGLLGSEEMLARAAGTQTGVLLPLLLGITCAVLLCALLAFAAIPGKKLLGKGGDR